MSTLRGGFDYPGMPTDCTGRASSLYRDEQSRELRHGVHDNSAMGKKKGNRDNRAGTRSQDPSPFQRAGNRPSRQQRKAKQWPLRDTYKVSHVEAFASAAAGAEAYTGDSFRINPGYKVLFPWCSGIAKCYERYRFTHLEFRYRSEASTTESGSVVLAWDPDPNDLPPEANEQAYADIQSYADSITENVWTGCSIVPFAKGRPSEKLYVWGNSSEVSDSHRWTDAGRFIFMTSSSADRRLGQLYVDYEVEFSKPKFSTEDESWGYTTDDSETLSATTFHGEDIEIEGMPIKPMASRSFRIPEAGNYLLSLKMNGTGISSVPTASIIGEGTCDRKNVVIASDATEAAVNFIIDVAKGAILEYGTASLTTLTKFVQRLAYYSGE